MRRLPYVELLIDRAPLGVTVTSPRPLSEASLHHPVLTWTAAVAAHWSGRTAFHGAAVVLEGRAWVLLGPPGAGKSTMTAQLAAAGVPVLSEDLTVVDGGLVLAGPRVGDLRGEAARHLGLGVEVVDAIGRPRWRIRFEPVPAEVPLGGFVELAWGGELVVERCPLVERLGVMARHDALLLGPGTERGFLDLMALPSWSLRRPPDWSAVPTVVDALRSIAQESAAT